MLKLPLDSYSCIANREERTASYGEDRGFLVGVRNNQTCLCPFTHLKFWSLRAAFMLSSPNILIYTTATFSYFLLEEVREYSWKWGPKLPSTGDFETFYSYKTESENQGYVFYFRGRSWEVGGYGSRRPFRNPETESLSSCLQYRVNFLIPLDHVFLPASRSWGQIWKRIIQVQFFDTWSLQCMQVIYVERRSGRKMETIGRWLRTNIFGINPDRRKVWNHEIATESMKKDIERH